MRFGGRGVRLCLHQLIRLAPFLPVGPFSSLEKAFSRVPGLSPKYVSAYTFFSSFIRGPFISNI